MLGRSRSASQPARRQSSRARRSRRATHSRRSRTRGGGHYSFWDYQANARERNDGIRIDHALLTPQAADLLTNCWIEADQRDRPKPSDHVPVWIDLDA